ncbi:ion channel [uncultured Maribacter sp.]|uniref:ion channel n=1 Tax=uncultured Maribacter sp. TaxID=431308 RepID=UPI002619FA65|nr:ion channel [uncultured Maribacter sp.]
MSDNLKEKIKEFGLGTKTINNGHRTLNKDGSFNVTKTNLPFLERFNFFHSLISMPWWQFFSIILLGYFVINTFFACLYLWIGVEHLTGIQGISKTDKFLEAFFFSAQTITTLGYGRVAPIGILANIVAAIESMLGLLSFALATGMVYGRFSKPSPKIKYSSHGVIAPFNTINAFMFKIVNPHANQLLEVEAKLTLSMKKDDFGAREFYGLDLQIPKVVFFPYMWTIVHPIEKDSPLFGLDPESFLEKDVEFMVTIKAFDESFSQTVYSRSSYKAAEINWGEKFTNTVKFENGRMTVDVSRLDETEKAVLN